MLVFFFFYLQLMDLHAKATKTLDERLTQGEDPEVAFWKESVTNVAANNFAHKVARKYNTDIAIRVLQICQEFAKRTQEDAEGTSNPARTSVATTTSSPSTSAMQVPPLVLPTFTHQPPYPAVPQQWGYGSYPSVVPQPMMQQPLQVPRPPTPILPTGRSTPSVMDSSFIRALDQLHSTPAASPSPLNTPTTEEPKD